MKSNYNQENQPIQREGLSHFYGQGVPPVSEGLSPAQVSELTPVTEKIPSDSHSTSLTESIFDRDFDSEGLTRVTRNTGLTWPPTALPASHSHTKALDRPFQYNHIQIFSPKLHNKYYYYSTIYSQLFRTFHPNYTIIEPI